MDIPNTDSVNYAFASAQSQAMQYRHEFITPEHLLSALLEQVPFQKALAECFCTPEELSQSISEYLSKEVERVPQEIEYELEISGQLSELLQYAYMTISHSSAEEMDVPHLVQGMLQLEDSWAAKRNSGRRYAGVSQLPHFKLRAHESVSRGNFL